MWVADCETHSFLTVNEPAIKSYGYSEDEFSRLVVKDLECPTLTLADHSAADVPGRCRHRKKDGSNIEVEITAVPVMFEGREADLVTATDITVRVRAECEEQVSVDIIQSVSTLKLPIADLLTITSSYMLKREEPYVRHRRDK